MASAQLVWLRETNCEEIILWYLDTPSIIIVESMTASCTDVVYMLNSAIVYADGCGTVGNRSQHWVVASQVIL